MVEVGTEEQVSSSNGVVETEVTAADAGGAEASPQPTMDEKTITEGTECLSEGKRLLKCGNLQEAVKKLSDGCEKLVEAYGPLAPETADAYFSYGLALLDLARLDAAVVASENLGPGQSQSAPGSSGPSGETVKSAVQEESVSSSDSAKDTPEGGASGLAKGAPSSNAGIDTGASDKGGIDKSHSVKAASEKPDVPPEDPKQEAGPAETEATAVAKADGDEAAVPASVEKPAEAPTVAKTGGDEDAATASGEKPAEAPTVAKAGGDEDAVTASEEKPEVAATTDKKAGASENQSAPDGQFVPPAAANELLEALKAAQEGEEEDESEEEEEGEEEGDSVNESQDEEASNIELAWENLETARVIYQKTEQSLKVAECDLHLAEVSMESENFEAAMTDLEACLKIRSEKLAPEDRLIAETYCQMGLCASYNKDYKHAQKYFISCVGVLEARLAILTKKIKSAEISNDDKKAAEEESKDLLEVVKDVKERCADAVSCQEVTPEEQSEIAMTTSPVKHQASKPDAVPTGPVTDISHLVRKPVKRVCDVDSTTAGEVKRVKLQENGDATSKSENGVAANGNA